MNRLAVALVVLSLGAHATPVELPKTLTLDQAIGLAVEHLPALRVARAGALASNAREREAFAPLLPTVSAGLGYSRSTSNFAPRPGSVPSSVGTSSSITLDSYDYWTGNLTASATLWDFGRNWYRYQASLSSADVQAATVHTAEVNALLGVRATYYQAAAQRDLIAVAKATLDNTEAHLAQVTGFVQVGTRPDIDLAQSKADRANARLALVNAKNSYAIARAKLNQAMGVEGTTTYEVADVPPGPVEGEEGTVEALMPEALKARPELAGLEAQLRAQQLSLQSTKAAYWPSLSAQLGTSLGARTLDSPVPNVSGQLSLSWPLYEGGVTLATVSEGEATMLQLTAQRDLTAAQVRLDVEQAVLSVGAAREAVDVSQEVLDAAREQLRLAEGRYRAGAGSAIELGDAQVRFNTASAQSVQARYSLATARAQLVAALGRR